MSLHKGRRRQEEQQRRRPKGRLCRSTKGKTKERGTMPRRTASKPPRNERQEQVAEGVQAAGPAILTIFGGPNRESGRKAKAHARSVGIAEAGRKKTKTAPTISFDDSNMEGISWPHDDAVVIKVIIGNREMHRILVDTGALVDMLSYDAYKQLGLPDDKLQYEGTSLDGFFGASAPIKVLVRLTVTIGKRPYTTTVLVDFMVVKVASAFNAILGCKSLNEMGAIVSTKHLKMKFPT
ncbi:uncharacterized protein LOC122663006 [Telopea speciosissima]|uniref:uncharacterized protein LOC122663006 n=1 Tax=Telopea speciosissima TaxID=54955 RepID=UPI001CC7219F|nr:uncharacterized protein LOC122663006 [Telopea speciosissima]